jgi:cellulose synthase/poly-beta-1,6-N-acetylglucosamine synthase-like glycosyltransferase
MELVYLLGLILVPYVALGILIFAKSRYQNLKKDYSYRPSVTVFVPTYNEEKNIERKLRNLLDQTYPLKEILVIDCSTDSTPKIVESYGSKYPSVKLIRQPGRIGFARTFNDALDAATGDIVIKSDCDSVALSKRAIEELVSNFSDERVGGATGICVAEGNVEKYFRKFMTKIQVAETNIDSTLIGHGPSLVAFRKKYVEHINLSSLADDTEELLLLRKKGYRTVVDPTVVSIEEVPSDYLTRRMQKDRRAQGVIKVLMQNFSMLFNPKYGLFGSIVLPLEWFILILSPFLLMAFVVILAVVAYTIHPLLTVGLIGAIIAAIVHRSNFISAIIDTEISGFMGLKKALFNKNKSSMWVKVRN